jgi:hypothetical protein
MKKEFWNIQTEKDFFIKALKDSFASPEELFYNFDGNYYAYISNGQKNNRQTLQSRNALIRV